MAKKTYLPSLIRLLQIFCNYTQRWNTQIRRNLPENTLDAFDALLLACDVFMAFAPEILDDAD